MVLDVFVDNTKLLLLQYDSSANGVAATSSAPSSAPAGTQSTSGTGGNGGTGTQARASSGGGTTPPNHYAVHVHIYEGETLSVRVGNEVQYIRGSFAVFFPMTSFDYVHSIVFRPRYINVRAYTHVAVESSF